MATPLSSALYETLHCIQPLITFILDMVLVGVKSFDVLDFQLIVINLHVWNALSAVSAVFSLAISFYALSRMNIIYKSYIQACSRKNDLRQALQHPRQNAPFPVDTASFTEQALPKAAILLQDVSFQIGRHERVALVGLNGSGKSTLIKLLLRLYDVDKGAVRINGRDVRDFQLIVINLHDRVGEGVHAVP